LFFTHEIIITNWVVNYLDSCEALKNTLLRNPSINLTNALSSIIKAFQNPVWTEQARERLKQIKLLTRVATV